MKCETFSSECFSYDREIATIQIDFVLVSFHTQKKTIREAFVLVFVVFSLLLLRSIRKKRTHNKPKTEH